MSARSSSLDRLRGRNPYSTRVFQTSKLRELKDTEQVAAVCYRFSKSGLEFLLVRTRGGRWTFPKGCTEAGLTYAQVAALEAFEEAGVHGRMQEASFTRYIHRKRSGGHAHARELTVHAHLCEVTRMESPRESNRQPTWFSPDKAKRRLSEDRSPKSTAEVVRTLDLAVAHIYNRVRAPALSARAWSSRYSSRPVILQGQIS